MAVIKSLKEGIINPFTLKMSAPSQAKVYIEIEYREDLKYLLGYKGFKQEGSYLGNLVAQAFYKLTNINVTNPSNQAPIRFQLPVCPPTIQVDTGSGNESNNVVQIGEVVMPKFARAKQFRLETFFPYDSSAPYINTTVRQSGLMGVVSTASNVISDLTEIKKAVASPQIYIDLFNRLNKERTPFKISMNYYQGGSISWTAVTINTFQYEPENNGDYKYQLSLIEWNDISPVKLNKQGQPEFKVTTTLKDVVMSFKANTNTTLGYSDIISQWWNICKGAYSIVSKNLIFWVAKYNGIKNLSYIRKGDFTWKFKNEFQSYASRYSPNPNIIGKDSISSSDTVQVSNSLKQLSFTKASQQMADYLTELGYDINKQ